LKPFAKTVTLGLSEIFINGANMQAILPYNDFINSEFYTKFKQILGISLPTTPPTAEVMGKILDCKTAKPSNRGEITYYIGALFNRFDKKCVLKGGGPIENITFQALVQHENNNFPCGLFLNYCHDTVKNTFNMHVIDNLPN
jgi:hypothetical protein